MMLLRSIQYTSPSDSSGGYRWFAPPDIPEAALEQLLEYLRKIDWANDADEFNGGIVLLPARDMGVVFRRVKVAAACGSRVKTTTNGLVFSIGDARRSGINGIWDLYLLSDPAENRQGKDIQFSPSPGDYPPGFAPVITELLCSNEESFCRIVKRDGVFSLRKILSESVAISRPEPFHTLDRGENQKYRWIKEQLVWTNNPLLVFFTGVMVGFILCLFLFFDNT